MGLAESVTATNESNSLRGVEPRPGHSGGTKVDKGTSRTTIATISDPDGFPEQDPK